MGGHVTFRKLSDPASLDDSMSNGNSIDEPFEDILIEQAVRFLGKCCNSGYVLRWRYVTDERWQAKREAKPKAPLKVNVLQGPAGCKEASCGNVIFL